MKLRLRRNFQGTERAPLPVLPVFYPYEGYNVILFSYLQRRAQTPRERFLLHKPNLKRLLSPPPATFHRFGGGDPVGRGEVVGHHAF